MKLKKGNKNEMKQKENETKGNELKWKKFKQNKRK